MNSILIHNSKHYIQQWLIYSHIKNIMQDVLSIVFTPYVRINTLQVLESALYICKSKAWVHPPQDASGTISSCTSHHSSLYMYSNCLWVFGAYIHYNCLVLIIHDSSAFYDYKKGKDWKFQYPLKFFTQQKNLLTASPKLHKC